MLRYGAPWAYPSLKREIAGAPFWRAALPGREGDVYLTLSDGPPTRRGRERNYGWQRENIAAYAQGSTARPLRQGLRHRHRRRLPEPLRRPAGDDTTVAALRLRARRAGTWPLAARLQAEDTAMMNCSLARRA